MNGMTDASVTAPLEAIKIIVQIALEEDAARHDRTSSLLPEDLLVKAEIVAKGRVVLSGVDAIEAGFGSSVRASTLASDGDMLNPGSPVATLSGSARAILSAERAVLNILGRLSGIATLTRRYVDKLDPDSETKILDTRKTTPGLRVLEKYAVRCGGGHNHRMNLAEMIFLKDNHIAAAGDLKAVLKKRRPDDYVIVEVDAPTAIKKTLALGPNRILLDNMTDAQVAECLKVIAGACEVEVSGGITLDRVSSLSKLGVNYISVGALTHSAPCADFSLEVR
jgi:nicotinate-nucleotide pyrophosphorylase (carboxylating)